jgi:hypothetical protein
LERLEERLAPVVGLGPDYPAAVPPGGPFDGVVIIKTPLSLGSGSLLYTGTDILTAAHCVTGDNDGPRPGPSKPYSGGVDVQFDMPAQLGSVTIPVPASDIFINPGYTGDVSAGHDIAIIHLPIVPPFAAQRYSLYSLPAGFVPNLGVMPELGSEFTFVGYGATGTGSTGAIRTNFGTKRSGSNTVEAPISSSNTNLNNPWTGPSLSAWIFDFDATSDAQDNSAVGGSEAMIGAGDSGGPAFINGQIAGLNDASGNGTFGDTGIETRVAYYEDWITSVLQQQSGQKLQMKLDMSQWTGSGNSVEAHRNGDNIELLVDGQVLFSETASQVSSLEIDSNDLNNNITVTSDLGIQLTLNGKLTAQWYDSQGVPADAVTGATLSAKYYNLPTSTGGNFDINDADNDHDAGNDTDGDQSVDDGIPPVGAQVVGNGALYTYLFNINNLLVVDNTPATPVSISPQSVGLGSDTIDFTAQTNVSVTTETSNPIVGVNFGTGNAGDTFHVDSTPVGGLTVSDGNDSDTVYVGDSNAGINLDGIGSLSVNGGTGTILHLMDEANQPQVFSTYNGSDTWDVETLWTSPTYLVTQSAITRRNLVTDTAQTVVKNQGSTVRSSTANTYTAQITYSNIARILIDGGPTNNTITVAGVVLTGPSGGNVFNVESTPANTPITITAGPDQDVVNIGAPDDLLENVNQIKVNGGAGTTVNLDDQANAPISPATAALFGEEGKATHPQYVITYQEVTRTDTVTLTDPNSGQQTTFNPSTMLSYQNIARLTINAGASSDTFDLESTTAGTPITINTDGGMNTVNVTPTSQDLTNLQAAVSVQASTSGTTSVALNDQQYAGHRSYTIDNQGVHDPDPFTINLTNVADLTLNGAASASYDLQAAPTGTAVTINPGSGPSTFNPAALTQSSGFTFNLAGTDLVVDDSTSTADSTYTVTPSTVQINSLPPISTSGVNGITVLGGSGNDTFNVQGTTAGVPVTVQAGSGSNTIDVCDTSQRVSGIQGVLTVNGQGANTTLIVNDAGTSTAENYTVLPTSIQRSVVVAGVSSYNTAPIDYSQVGHVAVYVGSAQTGLNQGAIINTLDVDGTEPGTVTDIYGNNAGGQSTFAATPYLSASSYDPANQILGPVHFHGSQIGLDTAGYYDSFDPTPQSYTMTAGQIVAAGFAPVTYDGSLYGASLFTAAVGGSTVSLSSTAAVGFDTQVQANAGDVVTVGSQAPSLGGTLGQLGTLILATVTPTQSATFILDDSGDPTVETASYYNDGYTFGFSGLSRGRIYCELGTGSNLQILGGTNPANSLTATFPGDFNQNWTVSGFSTSSGFTVPGNFNGQLLASTLGTATAPISQIQIGGTVTAAAKIKLNYLSSLSLGGDLAGTVKGFGNSGSQSQPTIGTITVGGNIASTGSITAPILGTVNVTRDDAGTLQEGSPTQDMQQLTIGGSLTPSGVVAAASIGSMSVGQDLAGQVTVTGPLNTLTVGGNLSGSVSAATIGIVTVAQNLTGQVTASQSLGIVTAAGKPVAQSIFLLDPSASAALNVSGSAHITIPGTLFVDSTSRTAVTATGSAQVSAASIQVAGGVLQSGSATFSPAPTTGVPSFTDPLAFLSGPNASGLTNYGAVSYSSGSYTLPPGIYSQIQASGHASLTLSPGLYVIEGGGMTVTGTASITGTGVTIYNTGSNYPNAGGSYGGITLSGTGSFSLTPASTPAGGAYPGVVLYQSRSNTRALALSGNAAAGLTGMVYAPSAPVVLGGNATLNAALVADRLQISGNGSSTQVAAGSTGDNTASPDTLLAGNLEVYINDPNGYFTPAELARIQDAITTWDALLAPYNVQISEVGDPALANVILDTGPTSAAGSATDGILGCYNGANNEITIVQGWNWYDGVDPTQIGATQYDFQTVVTHELGHALGLGGSSDPTSPMYETLAAGVVQRTPSAADLNVADPPAGADPERAALLPADRQAPGIAPSGQSALPRMSLMDAESTMERKEPGQPGATVAQPQTVSGLDRLPQELLQRSLDWADLPSGGCPTTRVALTPAAIDHVFRDLREPARPPLAVPATDHLLAMLATPPNAPALRTLEVTAVAQPPTSPKYQASTVDEATAEGVTSTESVDRTALCLAVALVLGGNDLAQLRKDARRHLAFLPGRKSNSGIR